MTVPAWQRVVASASAAVLESIGGPKIGGGLKPGSSVPLLASKPLLLPNNNNNNNASSHHTYDTDHTFIEFWSCQCSPCVEMVPKMKRLYRDYSAKVQFQTIHVDLHGATNDEITTFLIQNKIDYPVRVLESHDDDKVWETFQFTHLPHGLLLDRRRGTVLWSGSLFTHDLERVFHRFYGEAVDRTASLDDINSELVFTTASPSTAAAAAECSGGVCQRSKTNVSSTAQVDCSGGLCRRPIKAP